MVPASGCDDRWLDMEFRSERTENVPKRINYALDVKKFGQRLRVLRERRDLDGREFAEQSGIDYRTYNAYELGQRAVPPFEDMAKIARFHGMSLDALGSIAGVLPAPVDLKKNTPDIADNFNRWIPLLAEMDPVRRQILYDIFNAQIHVARDWHLSAEEEREPLPDWLEGIELDPNGALEEGGETPQE